MQELIGENYSLFISAIIEWCSFSLARCNHSRSRSILFFLLLLGPTTLFYRWKLSGLAQHFRFTCDPSTTIGMHTTHTHSLQSGTEARYAAAGHMRINGNFYRHLYWIFLQCCAKNKEQKILMLSFLIRRACTARTNKKNRCKNSNGIERSGWKTTLARLRFEKFKHTHAHTLRHKEHHEFMIVLCM